MYSYSLFSEFTNKRFYNNEQLFNSIEKLVELNYEKFFLSLTDNSSH